MTDALDTTSLLAQLAAHRATLAVFLRQLANLGADYAPPGVHNGIAEARREIARLKAMLRAAGVAVDDLPGDEATPDEISQAPRRSERQHQMDVDGSAQLGVAAAGDIHGSITINYGAAPAPAPIDPAAAQIRLAALPLDVVPAPAPLPPGSRMPLSANPLFVGREDDLKALAATLKAGTTTVIAAAIGMGGVGKTQLASEFAHRYGQFFLGGVFWLSFADPASVAAEIAACGAALDLPGFAALEFPDQVARVRQLWQEATPRLLIFDNCEDEDLLRRYRPTSGGCRVLVTSRRQRWDASLGVRERSLGTLPRPQSIALLHQFRPDLATDDHDLGTLAHALGDLPLALHVAGSYLKRYQRAFSPAQYLELLRGAPLQAFALRALSATPTAHERDLALTVAASYQRLDSSQAGDVLALAVLARTAYLAPGESILRELLEQTLDLDAILAEERVLVLEDALFRLDELGLSEVAEDGALRIHRLIAAFVMSVAPDRAAQDAVETALTDVGNRLVSAGFPARLAPLLAHLRHAWAAAEGRGDATAAELANALGRAEQALVNYAGARPLYERALAIREQVLGPQHPDTAMSLNNLAVLLKSQGDYAGARPLFERALAIREQVLGPQHPSTALSLDNLVGLLRDTGDSAGAYDLLHRFVVRYSTELGANHPLIQRQQRQLDNLGLSILEGYLCNAGHAFYAH